MNEVFDYFAFEPIAAASLGNQKFVWMSMEKLMLMNHSLVYLDICNNQQITEFLVVTYLMQVKYIEQDWRVKNWLLKYKDRVSRIFLILILKT